MSEEDQAEDARVAKRADMFKAMAERIERNSDAKFGGAFVLLPPGDGEPFSSLMLDQEEAAIFWSALQTIANMAVQTLDNATRQQGFRNR